MTPNPSIENLPGIPKFKSGKVREVYDLGHELLIVATDRISAFDCVLDQPIPYKGAVLTQLSAWWFKQMKDIVPHHMVSVSVADFPESLQPYADQLKGRSMLVKKVSPLPVECIVRGYLIGSGWKEYQRCGSVCGLPLREGYRMADPLDEAIFTPSSKADSGHDENISFEVMCETVGQETGVLLRQISLDLYVRAAKRALEKGIILADTKFEFGMLNDQLVLIDEIFTPDSSRFWPREQYQPGTSPVSFDKQFVRDYLEALDWNKTPPCPALPAEVIEKTSRKYIEAYELLTGNPLSV